MRFERTKQEEEDEREEEERRKVSEDFVQMKCDLAKLHDILTRQRQPPSAAAPSAAFSTDAEPQRSEANPGEDLLQAVEWEELEREDKEEEDEEKEEEEEYEEGKKDKEEEK